MTFKGFCFLGSAISAVAVAPAFAHEDVRTDEIIVTASPVGRSVEETIIGTSVIGGDELQNRLEASIGETLRREPGVSSTFFGPGASRPVIRGLGGDRISVLDAGIGSIDASATSPDHAVAVEPATAEKIEIMRGAATLLYGSSAAGGVVNVFSGRIPRALPEDGVDGGLRIGGSTVDEGIETAGGFNIKLDGDETSGFVFHGEGFYRKADDYNIPGFAESERLRAAEEEEGGVEDHGHEAFGVAENSAIESKGGAGGLSYVFDRGFIGVSGFAMNSDYGIPGGHGRHEGEEEEEGGVTIALKQRRLDLDSEIEGDFLIFEKAKLRVGYADYTHSEIEPSGEVGTVFANEGVEGRLELVDRPVDFAGGVVRGAAGFQFKHRNFEAIGEEAFTPATTTNQYGVFGLKEYERGVWRVELGGRYEHTKHELDLTGDTRSFDAFSVSGGLGLAPADGIFLGVTGFRTERAPSTEELFSDGPHLATGAYELGDPALDKETGRGVEATARFGNDRVSFTINGFYTSYKDFIFEADTGLEEDGLPVYQFVASDAAFKGFEAALEAELLHRGGIDVHADAAIDYVRATADGSPTGDLPRIPPLSGIFGLEANSAFADLRGEIEYAGEQNRIGAQELPTDSYTLYNFFVTLRPFTQNGKLAVRFAALNVTNEEARLHTSFLKDRVPLPGRNFKVSLTGTF